MSKMDFLSEKRTEIDLLDTRIIKLLGQRMRCSEEIGNYKKEHHIPILQEARWQFMLRTYLERGLKEGVSDNLIKEVFTAIHMESVRLQNL